MKEIKLLFYRTEPSEENMGLKQVLFKITDTQGKVTYDYGYCDWGGREWMLPEVPEGYAIEVHSWANNPDPKWLLDESKIITLK